MTDSQSDTVTSVKSKKPLLAILAVSILPIAAAYFVYFSGIGMPDHTVNAGRLLSPASPLSEILSGSNDEVLRKIHDDKKWRLLLPIPANCNEECQKNLYTTRQVYIRLGEKSRRVERYAVNFAGAENGAFLEGLKVNHPLLQYVDVDRVRWDSWIGATDLNLELEETPYYLLVDQEGFAMMAYTSNVHGNDLLKDLKRALKYSIDYQF